MAAFFLGAASLFTVFKLQPGLAELAFRSRPAPPADPMDAFRRQFFGGQDPFAEAERMREEMMKGMPGMQMIDAGGEQEVVKREDADAVYYEIQGVDQTKLQTKVDGGYLTIQGETRKKTGEEGGFFQAEVRNSFQRSFPLPPGVDEQKMELSSEKDKVILRFPKRNG